MIKKIAKNGKVFGILALVVAGLSFIVPIVGIFMACFLGTILVALSLKDGASTLTEFTARICSKKLKNQNIYACGGGRKNKFLMESIGKKTGTKIKLIDELDVDGDFIESQAFAYLAVRSYLNLPISFPETTGCKIPSMGGVLVKNF